MQGFDKSLDDVEIKIKGSVAKSKQSKEEQGDFEVGDTVAVFMLDWNKWIRGEIKAKNQNGTVNVWATDYGIPLISSSLEVVKLKSIYASMHIKNPRVRVGGLIHCVPSELGYDFAKGIPVAIEHKNWSAKALEIVQNAMVIAKNFKFDESQEIKIPKGKIMFGYLKIQKFDGSWIDLNKCLSDAKVAKTTTDSWYNRVHRLETVNQNEWQTINGISLHAHIVVKPKQFATETSAPGAQVHAQAQIQTQTTAETQAETQCETQGQTQAETQCETRSETQGETQCETQNQAQVEAQQIGNGNRNNTNYQTAGQQNENRNIFQLESDQRSFKRRSGSGNRSIRGGFNYNFSRGAKFYGHHSRNDRNDYSLQHFNGSYNNDRFYNRREREEIEFFQSAFRPPFAQKKLVPSAENAADESMKQEAIEGESPEKGLNDNDSTEKTLIDEAPADKLTAEKVPTELNFNHELVSNCANDDNDSKEENSETKQDENNDNHNDNQVNGLTQQFQQCCSSSTDGTNEQKSKDDKNVNIAANESAEKEAPASP